MVSRRASRRLPDVAVSVWEALFMLLVLKIPIAYLAAVVWWAIRAEPTLGGENEPLGVPASLGPCGWHEGRRPFTLSRRGLRPRPSGGPVPRGGRARLAPAASARR